MLDLEPGAALQILEEGRLTDAQGRTVDFRNTVLIMTSNLGSQALMDGVTPDGEIPEGVKREVQAQLRQGFRPEFLNRLDDVIIFRHLTNDNLMNVIDLELAKVRGRLEDRGLKLILTDDAKTFLISKGSNLDYGARPLRRAIENQVEDPLSEELLRGAFQDMDTITVDGIKSEKSGKVKKLNLSQAKGIKAHKQNRFRF